VAQVVKVHPGDNRWKTVATVAVDRRAEHAPGHGRAAQQAAAGTAEDLVVIMAVEDLAEQVDQE
jgi:hypothetical protein